MKDLGSRIVEFMDRSEESLFQERDVNLGIL